MFEVFDSSACLVLGANADGDPAGRFSGGMLGFARMTPDCPEVSLNSGAQSFNSNESAFFEGVDLESESQ
jgi:hypothetical protein